MSNQQEVLAKCAAALEDCKKLVHLARQTGNEEAFVRVLEMYGELYLRYVSLKGMKGVK